MTEEQELFELVNNTVINANAAMLTALAERSGYIFEMSIRIHRVLEQFDIYTYYYKENPANPNLTKIATRIRELVEKVCNLLDTH